jgi:hypothetical protein
MNSAWRRHRLCRLSTVKTRQYEFVIIRWQWKHKTILLLDAQCRRGTKPNCIRMRREFPKSMWSCLMTSYGPVDSLQRFGVNCIFFFNLHGIRRIRGHKLTQKILASIYGALSYKTCRSNQHLCVPHFYFKFGAVTNILTPQDHCVPISRAVYTGQIWTLCCDIPFIIVRYKVHPRTGHEGLNSSFNLGARWGGWSTPRPDHFIPGKDPVPTVYEAGWAPGSVWTGAENLAPTEIRYSDRPARSESLYRLSYPAPIVRYTCYILAQSKVYQCLTAINFCAS